MKRVFDIAVSASALLVLSPVLLVVALLVRWKLGSPVLFRQMRPGLNCQPFAMVKFRTMTDARGAEGELLSDRERLTPFGRFLRATSLDELPELWNVLKGEMSLVGPRPLLMRYLPYYSPREMRRHEVRPGVTGLAQIRGRNAITWEDKLAADVEYVESRSFALDLQILFLTVAKVFGGKGVLDAAPQGALDIYRAKKSDG
ncbi:sugar transferase [Ancylobacter dichloromethanicus]|uniref:Sugar transferase n=1 Tax=Ancylobacter dichloromethanicus TaxID=518825 RepID=A0A9W6JAP0_9HYPH|nr:sugar transferase [Ancylobacter dichloromethanicus]MBS7556573.1 sugar transferase [Ancylobacter dichloromethanicus]GLK72524.1 sugar transferase [Ancylobacter dichloromethanicus]